MPSCKEGPQRSIREGSHDHDAVVRPGDRAERADAAVSAVVLGETGRAPNGLTAVVLDGDTFDQITELANEWHNETLR